MSESQERMMAVVEPGDVERVPGDLREVGRRGRRRSARSPTTGRLADRLARRDASSTYPRGRSRTTARRTSAPSPAPTGRTPSRPTAPRRCRGRRPATSCARPLLRLVASPEPVRQVVDHRPVRPLRPGQHRARPARATPAWSASTRTPTSASRSPPTATAASPSSTRTPARSSRWPRPTATSPTGGAAPLAISDCLNFGSPEDPDVMWQFAEACRGLKDALPSTLGIPVTGGNVSLYNQTGETAILPTPVVAVLGVIDDVARRTPTGFVRRGRAVVPARRRPARSCPARSGRTSCTATSAGCRRGSTCAAEQALGRLLVERRARRAASTSAHDLSDGGLAQALVESCLRHDVGARVSLADGVTRSSRCSASRRAG